LLRYFAFNTIIAENGCSAIGGSYSNKTFAFDPSEISSVRGTVLTTEGTITSIYNSYSIDWNALYSRNCSTSKGYTWNPYNPSNLDPMNIDPCHPRIAIPPGLQTRIDPAWAQCITNDAYIGFYDPPHALTTQSELSVPTITPPSQPIPESATQKASISAPTATPTHPFIPIIPQNPSDPLDPSTPSNPGNPHSDPSPGSPHQNPHFPSNPPPNTPTQQQDSNPGLNQGSPTPNSSPHGQPQSPQDPSPNSSTNQNSQNNGSPQLPPAPVIIPASTDKSGNIIVAGQTFTSAAALLPVPTSQVGNNQNSNNLPPSPSVLIGTDGGVYVGDTIIGTISVPLPTPAPESAIITVASQTLSFFTSGSITGLVVGTQTLTAGGEAITLSAPNTPGSGQSNPVTISLAPSGGGVVIDGSTVATLDPMSTASNLASAPPSGSMQFESIVSDIGLIIMSAFGGIEDTTSKPAGSTTLISTLQNGNLSTIVVVASGSSVVPSQTDSAPVLHGSAPGKGVPTKTGLYLLMMVCLMLVLC
jgi:hypothetical protein